MNATTNETTPSPVEIGTVFHAVHSGLTIGLRPEYGVVAERRDEFTVTPGMLAAARHADGTYGWLDLLDNEDAQIARWGKVMIRRGPTPDDLTRWEPGTTEAREAREAARKAAWALPDDEARRKALEHVDAAYGPPPTTSTSLAHYADDRDVWKRRDAERAEADRLRHH